MNSNIDLKEIGFYTLSNERAFNSSSISPLQRCELILTDECNFKCPYCRGLREDLAGELPFEDAMKTLDLWISQGLQNVRFSGGEPTLYPGLDLLVKYCKDNNVKNIAISTNGSASLEYYDYLIECGANDFSISLDSGCCSIGDNMAGGIPGAWDKVVDAIKHASKKVYTTVGMVFTESNVDNCVESVLFADSLGVHDIRVIPAAQYDKALVKLQNLPKEILNKYKILNYRIKNINNGKHVRGITKDNNSCNCWLTLDDMAVCNGYHFPCIIYLREGGDPIGCVGSDMRKEREEWAYNHDIKKDPICSKMCLDVCVDYNNVANVSHGCSSYKEIEKCN